MQNMGAFCVLPQTGLALMGFSRDCPSSLDLLHFVVWERRGCAAERAPSPLGLGLGWTGEVVGPKMGIGKTWCCWEMVSKLGIMGFTATRMDCMVRRRCLGEVFSPQPPPENCLLWVSPIWGNLGWAPLAVTDVVPISPVFYGGFPVWGPVPGSLQTYFKL